MKRILAILLALVLLLSVMPSVGTVADAAVAADPFYALTWDPLDGEKFDNIDRAYMIQVKPMGEQLTLAGQTDPVKLAQTVKAEMDSRPDGMKYIRLFNTGEALDWDASLVIYADGGVKELKKIFSEFIKAYSDLGGKLDGVILDTEYIHMGSWYIYTEQYGGHYKPSDEKIKANNYNRNIYHDIVAHPKYKNELRPMLEEAGFTFYEAVGGDRSEIWSMYPPQTIKQVMNATQQAAHNAKYGDCYSIWNRVMYNRIAMYFNYAIYEPLQALYPEATMSDYQSYESGTWYKNLHSYTNGVKTGNVSNTNDYSHLPNASYFKSGSTYLYQNPASYNNAVYDDDPYGMLLWNINKMKNIYEATDTKKISVWISRYDYGRATSYKGNTAYYTESLYHYGMLDPQPFLVYMTVKEGGGQAGYDERLKYMSEALSELTRVAGYSDRKPISVPVNWNDGYLLSGMYANGRNIWRITPDTTNGTTLASFKVKDSDPTFKINGTTVTFPDGKIIKDTSVSLGSVGYWVETAKNVKPVVTRDADRYSENPSYMEDYESYKTGAALTETNLALPQTWTVTTNKDLVITAQGSGKALALTGTATLNNIKLPENITAGDNYAQQQAWEVSVTLPQAMNSGAKVVLLNTSADGGIKLEGGKAYYDDYGEYVEFDGVSLTAGQKYTFKRDIDFGYGICTYSVYAEGKLLKQAANVDMKSVTLPVKQIGISCADLTTQALIDDYKIYPTGIAMDLEVYDYYGGEELSVYDKLAKAQVGYRLSWMNATATKQTVKLKAAYYDSSNTLISESVLATVNMAAGDDAVITGTVVNKGAKIRVYVDGEEEVKPTKPTENTGAATKPGATEATKATKATTETKAQLTKPTRASQATRGTKATAATKPVETLAPGATLATDETVATGETLAPAETLAPEETLPTDATTPVDTGEDSAKGNNVILIAIIAVAVLAVGGAIWFFLVRKVPVPPVETSQSARSPEEITEKTQETEAAEEDTQE